MTLKIAIQFYQMLIRINKRGSYKRSDNEKQHNCFDYSTKIPRRQYIESSHSQRGLALLSFSITEQRLILMGFLQKKHLSIFEQEKLALLEKSNKNRIKCRNCMKTAVWKPENRYFCQDCGNCVSFGFALEMVGGEIDA